MHEETKSMVKIGVAITGVLLVVLLGTIWAWKFVTPRYNLYRAEVEKRILVEEARAERDAAVDFAEAERIRAQGVADANEIIAESITEEYVRWLYVDQLDQIAKDSEATIIYVPTEGGLPVLEANRLSVGGE